MKSSDLTARSQEILRAVVNIYVEKGEPVGSRTVAKRSAISFSPATIRNIMSDLAEAGLLTKPHVSAGRMPTDLGYRIYVDGLMGYHEVTLEERLSMGRSYSNQAAQLEQVLTQASRILSELTNNAGLVILPGEEQLHFKHIEFIRMAERKVLAVIVSKSGMVQNRIVPTDEDLSQEELDRISRYLNEEFKDLTLRELRQRVIRRMEQDRDNFDMLYRRALELSRLAFLEEPEETLFVEGASRVFSQPDFADDLEKLQSLYRAFEDKGKLVRILDRCLDSPMVTILIGSENALEGMADCSLVAQRYYMDDRPLGTIGIIGPKRMRYERMVSLVEWTASSVTRYLSEGPPP